jgi:hypothetical protein
VLAPVGFAAASGGAGASGSPSGDPSAGSTYHYGGDYVGLQWTNGDSSSSTRVYYFDPSGGCPSTFPDDLTYRGSVAPGVTSWETGETAHCGWWLVHYKNNTFSGWHQVITGIESCPACPV